MDYFCWKPVWRPVETDGPTARPHPQGFPVSLPATLICDLEPWGGGVFHCQGEMPNDPSCWAAGACPVEIMQAILKALESSHRFG